MARGTHFDRHTERLVSIADRQLTSQRQRRLLFFIADWTIFVVVFLSYFFDKIFHQRNLPISEFKLVAFSPNADLLHQASK